jgi:hypothetical protein
MLKDMVAGLLVQCIRTVHVGGRWREHAAVTTEALQRLWAREADV